MRIAIIGASGFIGSALLKEALARGHAVRALVGRPERLPAHERLEPVQADVFDVPALTQALRGREAVISAFSGHAAEDVRARYLAGLECIITSVKGAGVPRFLLVGGAGSLEVAPGKQLIDTPEFPEQWKASALAARDGLVRMRREAALDWTVLSPAALIHPGERTGVFRIGSDELLVGANGKSEVSREDFAVAMIDELEQPKHSRRRFTVAY